MFDSRSLNSRVSGLGFIGFDINCSISISGGFESKKKNNILKVNVVTRYVGSGALNPKL